MNIKKALLILFVFCIDSAVAQTYKQISDQIDSLANIGLPKSALVKVGELDKLAVKEKNVPQHIKAVIYRMTFQSYLQENALVAVINGLKNDIARAEFPVKPVLQSILADMYWQYYEGQRYQISRRTPLAKADTDFTRWDLRTIINETSRLYRASLADAKAEQGISLSVFDDVLEGDKHTRYLRPTLYDLLANRALTFYLAEEPGLPKPRLPFKLDDPGFFADSRSFANLTVRTTDTTSTYYLGIKLLQQATLFHLQKPDEEAMADLDLKRLQFIQGKSNLDVKDSLYFKSLEQLAVQFADKPISADARVLQAQFEQQKNNLVKAVEYLNAAIKAFPQNQGGKNAKALLNGILQKQLSATVENDNMPGQPLLALLNYRNTTQAHVLIYRISQNQKRLFTSLNWYYYIPAYTKPVKAFLQYLTQLKPVQDNLLTLPGTQDYRDHKAEFGINPLPPGNYIILLSGTAPADTGLTQIAALRVSGLAYTMRQNPDGGIQLLATDRITGAPLVGIKVILTGKVQRFDKQKKYNIDVDTSAGGLTDKNGSFQCKNFPVYNLGVDLKSKEDTLIDGSKYVRGAADNTNNDPITRTILFTDRQIYRPGQTIYFKALQLEAQNGKNKILANEPLKIKMNDVNNKTVGTLNLRTNDYGTVAGSFIIPQTALAGNFTLAADDGEIEVRVEEYKRPTFQVEFSPVKESYKPNDSVTVKGNVKAFSGYGLSQARVAYHITRSKSFRFYRYGYRNDMGPDVFKTDTIVTDDQGDFSIRFKALPPNGDANANFTFAINADVTDASGETRSGEASLTVGKNNIRIQAYLPKQFFTKDSIKIPFMLYNLNNQRIKGNIDIKVYALQNPANLFKNRLWAKPDQFLIGAADFTQNYPDYAYRNNDEPAYYPVLGQVMQQDIAIGDTDKPVANLDILRKQTSGTYKIVMLARNAKGDTVSTTGYVNLVAKTINAQSFAGWVVPVVNRVEPGGNAVFTVGINRPCRVLMEQYNGIKLISSTWLKIDEGQKTITVPIAASIGDSPAVQFLMTYRDRLYTSYQPIAIIKPEQSLDIRFVTYRDKMQPGEKELWKLQIKGDEKQGAEMVAALYDASLDDIAPPQNWQNSLNGNRRMPNYFAWNAYGFVTIENTFPLKNRYNNGPSLIYRTYENLNMFGYSYYGGYNGGYQSYLYRVQEQTRIAAGDAKLKADYIKNAAQVKNGYDVSGRVVDAIDGIPVYGVSVSIKGAGITTTTNSQGYFKIKVPVNGILSFGFVGYTRQEIQTTQTTILNIKLKLDGKALNEVAVVGYGTEKRKEMTGTVSTVTSSFDKVLAGRVAGVNVTAPPSVMQAEAQLKGIPGSMNSIVIRGNSSLSSDNAPLYVVDGVIQDGKANIDASEISGISVLKDASAVALYGARAANGVIVITTKKGGAALLGRQPITIRKNFNETAFFYPQLRTNENGEILLDFTIPEALTKWRFKAFAHTRDLKTGYLESEMVTQKQLSITANTPRFLREGDTVTLSARLANLTTGALQGKVNLRLFNALSMQPVNLLANPAEAEQIFNVAASTNKAFSFKLIIPQGIDALTYRLTADAGTFTDGEENTIAVLPNRTLVTESMPMMVRPGQTKAFNFDKLINQHSTTLQNKTLTLEYTQNPAWYAVQAMPYLMEFPYECSEQIFSRYYANSLSANLVNKMPVIKQVFDRWKATNSPELLSNLEKNQELKATLLEETPWLKNAVSETEQKKRIALLFDLNKMGDELSLNLDKLQKKQLADGGFPWFGGDRSDRYITQHIVEGIGQLYHLHAIVADSVKLKQIADRALNYLDNTLTDDYRKRMLEKRVHPTDYVDDIELNAWFARSYYPARPVTKALKPVFDDFMKRAANAWKFQGVYEQGMIALVMQRAHKGDVAAMITRSLMETAQQSDDMGMYWAKNTSGYFWYQSQVETQCLLIELFTETGGHAKAVEEMKIWLLRNKQTNDWKTTKATAAACYALLLNGDNWLADQGTSQITLGGQPLEQLKPDIKADAGTGYLKTTWADEQVKPEMGKVNIISKGKTISWGAMHWQYLENLDKITPSNTDIHLERKYFIVKQTDRGEVLTAFDAANQPKTGDLLKVVVYLKAGRDYDYVQLKDMRPAGTEPVDAISSYKYQDGLYYYQVTKDVATNFFISYLNKGNYVFEYRLRVAQPGNFSTGISTVQSMYAPEFNAHSEGTRMTIKP